MKLPTLIALIVAALLIAMSGCTAVKYDGFSYTNVGFEKQVGKVSFAKNPDGTVTGSVEGVKNTTPQIVEAAVGAAVRGATK